MQDHCCDSALAFLYCFLDYFVWFRVSNLHYLHINCVVLILDYLHSFNMWPAIAVISDYCYRLSCQHPHVCLFTHDGHACLSFYVGCILSSQWVIGFCRSMAAGRWMAECFATTTHSKRSATPSGKGGHVHKFPVIHTGTRTHTLDKLMNSARGGVLDQSGTCYTTVWDRLTKTTETAKRKGEKRIGEKWEARRDKSWREWRQKRGKTGN